MWKDKLTLIQGQVLVHKSSKTKGFMGETDVDDYSIVAVDGSEAGTVRVEDHTAVKGFRRTITVVQADIDGKEVIRTSFHP